ncbi:hypothetical protein J2847_000889 [Azospirillum agricola]|uniref:hypothetical protein n=1 Tax=Azospirillum agricola TaxID=1720247 RepID=UPI001AE3DD39|nr:hypothetical protein [Azospirillum agricola]MBP2227609.1 hypothetical protein [Azospirillum agricola]
MRLQTDPSCFSITAFLADQVSLVARKERLPPGAALLRLQEWSRTPEGRKRLLLLVVEAAALETHPHEAAKIDAIRDELAARGYDGRDDGHGGYDNGRHHRAAA